MGAGHDQLAASGAAMLDGSTLDLRVPSGAALSLSSTFTVLTASAVTGRFATVTEEPGYDFTVAYTPTSAVVTVSRINQAPTLASLTGTTTGAAGSMFAFSASASDPENQPLTYRWDYGDGSPVQTAAGLTSVTHVYATPGAYTVTLRVDAGVVEARDTRVFEARERPLLCREAAGVGAPEARPQAL